MSDKCERCGLLKGEGGCEADTEAAWRESPLGSRLRCRDREITTHRKRITELEAALAERGVTLLPQRPQDGDDGSGNSQDPQGEP